MLKNDYFEAYDEESMANLRVDYKLNEYDQR